MGVAHVGLVHCDPCKCKVKGFRAVSSIERNVSNRRHLQGVRHFSTASTIQSSIHPISSILSLHQCSLSSFHPLLTLSPPSLYSLTNNCYSINPYLLYASHITSPSSYLPYTQFSYTLHQIFPSITTIFPSTTSTIPYSMLLFPTTHMSRTLSLLSPALHHHNSRITPTPLLHCTLASMMFLPLS